MSKYVKKSPSIIHKYLEYLGKPAFFLFTFLALFALSYLHLIKLFTLKIKQLKAPHFNLPKLSFNLRSLRVPKLQLRPIFIYTSIFLFISTISTYYFYIALLRDLPSPATLKTESPALASKIYDRHGNLLYQIYRDENRSLVKLDDLPQHLIDATIASEDKDFYTHHGISFKGMMRATIANTQNFSLACLQASKNCPLQGGSTITQQLIKNSLLTPERTLSRKFKEIYLSLLTEQMYSKNEILEFYFNYVPYGGTAYGIEEAASQYFGKKAAELNLAESAFLAGLPIAPSAISPFGNRPYLAKNRQTQVLDSMVKVGYISEQASILAKSETLNLKPNLKEIKAPHFVMYVKDLLVKQLGEATVSRGGLEVITTLDLSIQDKLESEINLELERLSKLSVGNGAGLITSPPTGEILAMVGSRNYFDSDNDGQVNLTQMERQPGSAIKPLTYTLALMQGLTPATQIDDSPICFREPYQADYCPQNYDGKFHGKISLRTALASSYNIPAIKLLNSLGVENLVKLARNMGINTWQDSSRFGLALTLGGGEITMIDLAQAYSVFANDGYFVEQKAILSVKDSSGRLIPFFSASGKEQIIPSSVAYQISSILADQGARAPAFGYRSILNIPGHQVAVKTGTTNDLRDNWTIGYTKEYLTATWVGNNDNTPMSSVASGITGASPIWSRTMSYLLKDSAASKFAIPAKMVAVKICAKSGQVYCDNSCEGSSFRVEYFIPGTEPKSSCHEKIGTVLETTTAN